MAVPQCWHLQVLDTSSALHPEEAAAPALSPTDRLALRRKENGDPWDLLPLPLVLD